MIVESTHHFKCQSSKRLNRDGCLVSSPEYYANTFKKCVLKGIKQGRIVQKKGKQPDTYTALYSHVVYVYAQYENKYILLTTYTA